MTEVAGEVADGVIVHAFTTEKYLRETAYTVDEPRGSGRAILFAADPNFRLLWPSLNRLFLNALLFGPSVR